MIHSFRDEASRDVYLGVPSKKALSIPVEIWVVSRRKLDMLNAASALLDLAAPPGNRLKKLEGRLGGYYGIRINDKFRIIFKWSGRDAHEVQIIDYH